MKWVKGKGMATGLEWDILCMSYVVFFLEIFWVCKPLSRNQAAYRFPWTTKCGNDLNWSQKPMRLSYISYDVLIKTLEFKSSLNSSIFSLMGEFCVVPHLGMLPALGRWRNWSVLPLCQHRVLVHWYYGGILVRGAVPSMRNSLITGWLKARSGYRCQRPSLVKMQDKLISSPNIIRIPQMVLL